MAETALHQPERMRPSFQPIETLLPPPADEFSGALAARRSPPVPGTDPFRGALDGKANIAGMLALAWAGALEGGDGRHDGSAPLVGETPYPARDSPPWVRAERMVLIRQASHLVSVLFGTPFEPDAAQSAGRALVAAGFTGAEVLGCSLRLLMLRLPMLIRALPGFGMPGAGRPGTRRPATGQPATGQPATGQAATGQPGTGLPEAPAGLPADLERRLADVAGAFANGYVSELRDRTLAEQEAIRHAERSAERAARLRLLHLATHDQLTGLLNRAALLNRLSAVVDAAGPGDRVGLCYLDLDGFKPVNDQYGHGAGDQLLIALAERIGRIAHAHGAVAARIGGDEFVVLAETSPGLPGMVALAADLLEVARRPVALTASLPSVSVGVSACVGIVERPAVGATVECLVADADAALYEAKSGGGGRWTVYDRAHGRANGQAHEPA